MIGMNTICIVLDRWHAGYLGPYGNSWIETPTLNRLAVESFIFDQFLIDSPRLESLYRSCWQGVHPLRCDVSGPTLIERLAQAGVRTALLTDEPAVANHPLARGFDPTLVMQRPGQAAVAEEIDGTHLARCTARLIDWLSRTRKPFFLWAHLAGLGGPWDAPLEFRRHYAAEDDPDPPTTAEVPSLLLAEGYDPDQLLGISQTYAGQVALWDTCLGALVEWLDSSPLRRDTLLVLLSARGFPLGEHRRVGPYDEALYGELVHVPLVLRLPDGLGAGFRTQALVQPADLMATLADWWQLSEVPLPPPAASLLPLVRDEVESIRDRLCVAGGDHRAIRVPAWYLRNAEKPELFVKPDDRWEVNDVADRCGAIAESLQQLLGEYEQAVASGQFDSLTPLEEILLVGPE